MTEKTPKEKALKKIGFMNTNLYELKKTDMYKGMEVTLGIEAIEGVIDIALQEQAKQIIDIVSGGFGLNAIQLRKYIINESKIQMGGK